MVEKVYASNTLGLELDSMSLKAALVSQQRQKIQIEQLYTFRFHEPHKHSEHQVNPLNLDDEGKTFLDLASKNLVVSAINASETLIRPLEIKLKKEKDIDAVLLFQAEPLLPYPIENAIVDKIVLGKEADGTQMTLLGVRKDHLQHHLIQWQPLEIEPEIVVSMPSALSAFSAYILAGSPQHFVLHLGERQTCCVFVKEGKLIAAQSTAFDLHSLKQTLSKDMQIEDPLALEEAFATMDWKAVSNEEYSLTAAALRNFQMEINRIVYALVRQVKLNEVPPILLTGDAPAYESLLEPLLGSLQKLMITPDLSAEEGMSWIEVQTHAIPIGSALMGLLGYTDQVNFRQADFVFPNPWRRLIMPLGIYAALMCVLAGSLYFYGQAYLKSYEDRVRRTYADLLVSANLPYQEVENDLANKGKKNPSAATAEVPRLKSLSLADIQRRIDFISKNLQANPDYYPLQPNVPRVSDLLAWLATHPNVIGETKDKPLIQIDSLNYTMVKRPELTKRQEKYQVRVELEFTAANATAAREFHDALLAPNAFVDPKGDVKWTTQKGTYKAVFFLKDRTAYP